MQPPPLRHAAFEAFLEGLEAWQGAMRGDGPFFLGEAFGFADIALAPWWQRMHSVIRHYRGFEIPPARLGRLVRWGDAVMTRPSFARTCVDPDRLIANYSGYADDSATSAVAQQFREPKRAKI